MNRPSSYLVTLGIIFIFVTALISGLKLSSLPTMLAAQFSQNTSSSALTCNTSPTTLSCFEVWRRAFLGEIAQSEGDFNGDARSTLADFELWRRMFIGAGSTTPTPPAPIGTQYLCIAGNGVPMDQATAANAAIIQRSLQTIYQSVGMSKVMQLFSPTSTAADWESYFSLAKQEGFQVLVANTDSKTCQDTTCQFNHIEPFLKWLQQEYARYGSTLFGFLLIDEPYGEGINAEQVRSLYSQAKAIAPNIPLVLGHSRQLWKFGTKPGFEFSDGMGDIHLISALEYYDQGSGLMLDVATLQANQSYSRGVIAQKDPDALILSSVQVFGPNSQKNMVVPPPNILQQMIDLLTDPALGRVDGFAWQSWNSKTTGTQDTLSQHPELWGIVRATCLNTTPTPDPSVPPAPTEIIYPTGGVSPTPTAPAPLPTLPLGFQGCSAGSTIECTTLGASWTSGSATCRADLSGYDTSGCIYPGGTKMEMVKPALRDASNFAKARCNDGSPFGFEIQLAPAGSEHADTWVVSLQGGGWCDDYSNPCSNRGQFSRSPAIPDKQLYPSMRFGGVLSSNPAENPQFHNANRIFAYYCSSDNWSGTINTPIPTTGGNFYFSGHAIVRSIFGILGQRYGLDDQNPQTRVLFTGTSAGACGVNANAHVLKNELLPQTGTAGRLKLLLDACWVPEWDKAGYRIHAATTSNLDVFNHMAAFWNAKFDPACEASYPITYSNPGANRGNCFFLKYAYPFLTRPDQLNLPVLVQNSTHDSSIAVEGHGISRDPADPVVREWKALNLAEFAIEPVKWIFSGNEIYHTISTHNSTQPDSGWCRVETSTGERFCDLLTRFWNQDYSGIERAITP